MEIKKFTLKFIQIAWVSQTIVILAFSLVCLVFLPPDRLNFLLQLFPLFTALIAAQGTAASIGPLVADKIKNGREDRSNDVR